MRRLPYRYAPYVRASVFLTFLVLAYGIYRVAHWVAADVLTPAQDWAIAIPLFCLCIGFLAGIRYQKKITEKEQGFLR